MPAPAPLIPTERLRPMRRALLAWYDRERRRLPWRENPSAYGTVVSEFMLQQTQVVAVVPYFERFLTRFPSFKALRAAPEEEVLAEWSGLGYYRRARALKRVAEAVVKKHGGDLPPDPDLLADLPGFGPYTVAAVGSIALGLPLAAVDGNVRRVVARLFAVEGAGEARRVAELADALLDPKRPGDWNQAMMELGATVCSPRAPRCLICPLRSECEALRQGRAESIPAPRPAKATLRVREVAVAALREGKILLLQRGEGGSFAGMWELPRLDSRETGAAEPTPEAALFDLARLRAGGFRLLGTAQSTFTHHQITTEVHLAERLHPGPARRQRHIAHRWTALTELPTLAASRAQRRLFEIVTKNLASAQRGKREKRQG